jgi:hypothetical protein
LRWARRERGSKTALLDVADFREIIVDHDLPFQLARIDTQERDSAQRQSN